MAPGAYVGVLGAFAGVAVLGRSWAPWFAVLGSLGSLLTSLGRLGSALRFYVAGLGQLLGHMLAVLGALGAVLDRLRVVLGGVDGQERRASDFAPLLDGFLAPSWVPKEGQDGAQNDQKSIQKSSQKTIVFWTGLKTISGRSWADLGLILGGLGVAK